jgi:4-amino-4-deoxy-L-arabinose transferase-like glycosyltransferase
LAATLFFTFGFLVKFVAALFLPLAAGVALWVSPEGRRRLREEWRMLAAACGLFLLLAAPWFVYQHLAHGALFWRVVFGQHVVERFTHHLDPGHLHPFSYYFATFWSQLAAAGLLAWVLLGLGGWLAAAARRRPFFGVLVPVWALLPLLLISLGTSKLVHYAYPFLPPLGLFAGYAVARCAALARWRSPLAWLAALALALPPALHYVHSVERLGQPEHPLQDLAACLRRGDATTLVEEGRREPLVFVHAFLTDGIYHPVAFYSRRGAALQQLDTPDDRLLFFRLYLPPHQAATVVPELLWRSFREHLADPDFRAAILDQAGGLGAPAETARLLADPAALPEPPGFEIAGSRYFLPGPYAACVPRRK